MNTIKLSKSDALLKRSLDNSTAVDTDEGTPALWAHLQRCGYVTKNTRTGRGVMGHYFSMRITDAGREHLKTLA